MLLLEANWRFYLSAGNNAILIIAEHLTINEGLKRPTLTIVFFVNVYNESRFIWTAKSCLV